MTTPKYDSTVNLGNILQISAILISMFSGVWYVSGRQEALIQQNRQISEKLADHEVEVTKLRAEFVRRDVSEEHDKVLTERFDQILSELQVIKARVGLGSSLQKFYREDNPDNLSHQERLQQ